MLVAVQPRGTVLEHFTIAGGAVHQAQVTVASHPIQPTLILFSIYFLSELPNSRSKGFVVI